MYVYLSIKDVGQSSAHEMENDPVGTSCQQRSQVYLLYRNICMPLYDIVLYFHRNHWTLVGLSQGNLDYQFLVKASVW